MAGSERKAGAIEAGVAAISANVSPLAAFNALAPRDPATRAAQGLSYGPDPLQTLDVYAPKVLSAPAPVLIFFHGGGWDSGRRQDYGFAGRALASRGFVTLVADYRLVPQVRFPDFMHDAALAARWAVDHVAEYGGDPNRITFAGHSAGAYIAVLLGLDVRFLQGAGVDPARVRAMAGLAGPYSFLPLRSSATQAAFGHLEALEHTQPINHVRPGAPPTFLGHGGKDTTVTAGNTVRMGRALTAAGSLARVEIYQPLNHADTVLALSRPFRKKGAVLEDMTAFLAAHAGA
ncbi:MAG: alpha/beta hydrolase [Caulobacteraceae bacterium]|nr:alpha/beta hydrolase [Caulobacteraceae bacterium]